LLPRRAKDRIEHEEPNVIESSSDIDDPRRSMPKTDRELPSLQ
jgi:hypothetical protein